MNHLHGSHDMRLVVLSYIVAVIASYTMIGMVERITNEQKFKRTLWLLFGSFTMGMGIWSMHFIGMLAFTLTEHVKYNLFIVFISVIASIAASFFALHIVSFPKRKFGHILSAGLLLAAGISAMHYIGMEAMSIHIVYDPFYFVLSILIAIIASMVALWLAIYFEQATTKNQAIFKIGSAFIMGAAIAGMHYTGMMAASFHFYDFGENEIGVKLNYQWLAYIISTGTIVTLGISILGIYIARKFAFKDNQLKLQENEIYLKNQELKQLNEHLEELVAIRTDQLAKAHDEAIQANLIKSQFLANMSHELRTPLNAIIGYSEMLQEEAEEIGEPIFVDDLSKISKAGHHLLSLINDILDISKIEAGKTELHYETCNVQEFIQDVVSTIQPLVASKGNEFIVEQLDEMEMTTDITKLRQIILNLLSNANKFTESGKIHFSVAAMTHQDEEGLQFTVKDNGIGMSEEQLLKIFQPFTQADASTTRKYGGTGLGLAISQKYSQLLGGYIKVASELSVGTTFTLWLPRSTTQQANANMNTMHEHEDAHKVHILLIEDERYNQELMERYLSKTGWKLAIAENGPRGIELAKKLRPQVICLDILMPSMDGWSVLTALKADPELANIPVVIWSLVNDHQLGYSLGAADFLVKPVQKDQLLLVMNKYIMDRTEQRVLVVEDDENASELVTRLLQKEGYSVAQANNGKIALERLQEEIPSIILLDLMMPEMDGFQFLDQIKEVPNFRAIPVVVITAKTITADDRAKLHGAVKKVIHKGSEQSNSLLDIIKQYI